MVLLWGRLNDFVLKDARLSLVLLCAANTLCGVAAFVGLLKVCDNAAMRPGCSGLGKAPLVPAEVGG